MSTKKIEGYGNEATESWSANHPTGSKATWLPATLVIHSGERDTVHTGAEVREMLKEAEEQVERMTTGKLIPAFLSIAKKHGIEPL